jgi:NAD(P)-dependent dehydrogenase (short-subunit alcohol dehydrogenase family)
LTLKKLPLKSKIAVVTGAGGGMGTAISQALAEAGCALALGGRHLGSLRACARRLGKEARVLTGICDVRDERSVAAFFARVRRDLGRVDFLINNAGISHALQPVSRLPVRVWKDVIDTNLTGTFLCTRAALPLMRRGGVIVNNLSIAARMVFPGQAAYSASKHGALGLTDTLREELRKQGIRVLALVAGATATDIWDQFMPQADRAAMMSPAEVAVAILHALEMPPQTAVEEIRILPLSGTR